MLNDDSFFEQQRFTQTWIWLILYSLWGGLTIVAAILVITKKTSLLLPILIFAGITIVVLFFKSLKLEVRINANDIRYRFLPLQRKFKMISRPDIEYTHVIAYDPLSDYGGWGIRFGKKGLAYTVKGNYGLSIGLTSKKNFLLGTSKPKEMETYLIRYGF